jgi:hypothetical protein
MSEPLPIPALIEEWFLWCAWITDPLNRDNTNDPIGHSEFVWTAEHHPDHAWEAILKVVADPRAERYLGHLAAGLVEDLLLNHGESYIERVEAAAKDSAVFANMLSGVCKFTMSDQVWERVQKVKGSELR